jgi:hypothetical protein
MRFHNVLYKGLPYKRDTDDNTSTLVDVSRV